MDSGPALEELLRMNAGSASINLAFKVDNPARQREASTQLHGCLLSTPTLQRAQLVQMQWRRSCAVRNETLAALQPGSDIFTSRQGERSASPFNSLAVPPTAFQDRLLYSFLAGNREADGKKRNISVMLLLPAS